MNSFVFPPGVSETGRFIDKVSALNRRFLRQTAFAIHSRLLDELGEAWEECKHANWDGYGALPVTRDALRNAYCFLEALPFDFPAPTIAGNPNGFFALEWYRNPRRVISVNVTPDCLLHYAALRGANREYGTEAFYGDIPQAIFDAIRRVYS